MEKTQSFYHLSHLFTCSLRIPLYHVPQSPGLWYRRSKSAPKAVIAIAYHCTINTVQSVGELPLTIICWAGDSGPPLTSPPSIWAGPVSLRPFLTSFLRRDFICYIIKYHLLVFLKVNVIYSSFPSCLPARACSHCIGDESYNSVRTGKVLQHIGTSQEILRTSQSFLLQEKLIHKSLGLWLSVGLHVPRLRGQSQLGTGGRVHASFPNWFFPAWPLSSWLHFAVPGLLCSRILMPASKPVEHYSYTLLGAPRNHHLQGGAK